MLLARRLAEFAVQSQSRKPPPEVMAAARLRLLDGLAVGLAALGSEGAPRARVALALFGKEGEASGIGLSGPLPVAAAALHNGLLLHGLEYDDTHVGAVVHGAPVVLPAVLAAAENEAKSGADALAAICVGWEVLARIGAALRGTLQPHGFQATSVAGPLAAAAAVASLAGLGPGRTTHAIGIAGSQSSGVFEFLSTGATSKALHGGWAALAGLVAAGLAGDGMTGPASILEGKKGLFAAFARAPQLAARMESQLTDLGNRWAVTEARPKAAPTCHYILAFLEALEEILAQGVSAAQIRVIECIVDPRQADLICEPWAEKLAPPSGYAAKWSLPFCLAARALLRPIDVALFERPLEPEVLAFARRIEWRAQEDGFPDRYPGRLAVTLHDGRTLESYVPDVLGGPGRKFPEERLLAKFRGAASAVLPASDVEALLQQVQTLERAPSVRSLGPLLRAARARAVGEAREAA